MELIDPGSSTPATKHRMGRRIFDVNNSRIGILANGKANAELLARETARFYVERHDCSVVDFFDKQDASRPCPEEHLQKLSESCDFMITAVGD
jgi:hypothetical protein